MTYLLNWIFNVKEIENRYGISNQTARTDISGLVKLEYLEVSNVNAKEQKYYKSSHFDELIQLPNLCPERLIINTTVNKRR